MRENGTRASVDGKVSDQHTYLTSREREKRKHPRLPCGLKKVGQDFLVEKFLSQVTHQ